MRILFLDIDGVLNSERSGLALGGYPQNFGDDLLLFDNVALGLLRRLVRVTGCAVILSSTWRLLFSPEQVSTGLGVPVLGMTPDLGSYETRGAEITTWLEFVRGRGSEIEAFAIVDDMPVFDAFPELQARFVQTNPQIGLSLDDYRRLRNLLAPDCDHEAGNLFNT